MAIAKGMGQKRGEDDDDDRNGKDENTGVQCVTLDRTKKQQELKLWGQKKMNG